MIISTGSSTVMMLTSGLFSSERAAYNVVVLPLPDGLDPDYYIETHGFEKFQYFVRNGKMHYLYAKASGFLVNYGYF